MSILVLLFTPQRTRNTLSVSWKYNTPMVLMQTSLKSFIPPAPFPSFLQNIMRRFYMHDTSHFLLLYFATLLWSEVRRHSYHLRIILATVRPISCSHLPIILIYDRWNRTKYLHNQKVNPRGIKGHWQASDGIPDLCDVKGNYYSW